MSQQQFLSDPYTATSTGRLVKKINNSAFIVESIHVFDCDPPTTEG